MDYSVEALKARINSLDNKVKSDVIKTVNKYLDKISCYRDVYSYHESS